MNPPIAEHPSVQYQGGGRWKLISDLHCTDDEFGDITVPAGFVTDFDSVPRLPFAHVLLKGRTVTAAVVHDYAYNTGTIANRTISRRDADKLFHRLMKDEGVALWRRSLIYTGVRLGGWRPWGRHRQ